MWANPYDRRTSTPTSIFTRVSDAGSLEHPWCVALDNLARWPYRGHAAVL